MCPICCQLTLRKIAIWLSKNWQKLDIFSQKIDKNFHFFQKNCHWQFFWKKWQFLAIFFEKNVKFLPIFWQSNGNFPEGQPWTNESVHRFKVWFGFSMIFSKAAFCLVVTFLVLYLYIKFIMKNVYLNTFYYLRFIRYSY